MNFRRVVAAGFLAACIEMVVGCGTEIIDPVPPDPPVVAPTPTSLKAVAPEAPDNVLSARIIFEVWSAPDSVRISYQSSGAPLLNSPAEPGQSGTDTITLLG